MSEAITGKMNVPVVRGAGRAADHAGELDAQTSIPLQPVALLLPDRFITHGSVGQLLEEVGLTPALLVDRLRPLLRGQA